MIQCCKACGADQHPPEELCVRCGSTDLAYRASAGTGTIFSFTIVDYPVHPLLKDAIPYVIVLITLDDMPEIRIVGNLVGYPPDATRIGLAVRSIFTEVPDPAGGEPLRLPHWEVLDGRLE